MEFSRPEYWSGQPFSSPGDLPTQGSHPGLAHCRGFCTSWATREAQEYWSGQPVPSPGDLPDPGIELGSSSLQADSLPIELWGKPNSPLVLIISINVFPCYSMLLPHHYLELIKSHLWKELGICLCFLCPWVSTWGLRSKRCVEQFFIYWDHLLQLLWSLLKVLFFTDSNHKKNLFWNSLSASYPANFNKRTNTLSEK